MADGSDIPDTDEWRLWEELYDTAEDPFELNNLADDPAHARRLERMRAAHFDWVERTGDLGAVPEAELAERFWPGGEQPQTEPPLIEPSASGADGAVEVRLTSITEGASIAYTMETGESPLWLLYTGPVRVLAGATLRARAVRYGYAESTETRFDHSG